MKRPLFVAMLLIVGISYILFFSACTKEQEEDVSGKAPLIEILVPDEGKHFLQGDTIHIAVRAQKTGASIKSITIYIDGSQVISCDSLFCSVSLFTMDQLPGIHKIRVVARDIRGEEGAAEHHYYILENGSPPEAKLEVSQDTADVLTEIQFDASACIDQEDSLHLLEVRWDWENDGIWDSQFIPEKLATHFFVDTGNHIVRMEVRDTDGMRDTTSVSLRIVIPSHPCPGLPSIEYGGKTYHTVKVGEQCWLRENLDIGNMINTQNDQSDNGVIEKYCYDNQEDNCKEYGGLYQWDELMAYDSLEGVQGICPPGWHIPSDGEWCTLTKTLNPWTSCIGYGHSLTGADAGGRLKETGYLHWAVPNYDATNNTGFTVIPAGLFWDDADEFGGLSFTAFFWSSTKRPDQRAMLRYLINESSDVGRDNKDRADAFSVRCIQD